MHAKRFFFLSGGLGCVARLLPDYEGDFKRRKWFVAPSSFYYVIGNKELRWSFETFSGFLSKTAGTYVPIVNASESSIDKKESVVKGGLEERGRRFFGEQKAGCHVGCVRYLVFYLLALFVVFDDDSECFAVCAYMSCGHTDKKVKPS